MHRLSSTLTRIAIGAILIAHAARGGDGGRVTAFDFIQSQANELTEVGGLAAVGVASGPKDEKEYVVEEAARNARMQVARFVRMKLSSLKRDFAEEIGANPDEDLPGSFQTFLHVSEALCVHAALFSITIDDEKIVARSQEGETTVYVVACMDPRDIVSAMQSVETLAGDGLARFYASQAFLELLDEVKSYAPQRAQ